MQRKPGLVASRTESHGTGATGGFQRSAPSGAAAYGNALEDPQPGFDDAAHRPGGGVHDEGPTSARNGTAATGHQARHQNDRGQQTGSRREQDRAARCRAYAGRRARPGKLT